MVGNSRKQICMKSTEGVSQAMVVVLFPLPGTFVVGWSYFRGLALDRDARFSGAGRGRHIPLRLCIPPGFVEPLEDLCLRGTGKGDRLSQLGRAGERFVLKVARSSVSIFEMSTVKIDTNFFL